MPLPFRPNCLPTALGPLPHASAREAWNVYLEYTPSILPVPLLATSGEDPLTLALDGFGGASTGPDYLAFDPEHAFAALDDLYLAFLQDRFASRALDLAALDLWAQREPQIKRALAVSTVIMGPISAALRLADHEGQTALTNAMLVDALAKHLCLRLEWQQDAISDGAASVIHWLYEPYLSIVGSPFAPIDWDAAQLLLEETFGANSGVHAVWIAEATDVASVVGIATVEAVGLPLPLPNVAEAWAAALGDFIRRRGVIGWGMVPQTRDGLRHARVGRLAARFGAVLRALEDAGLPTAEVVRASLIMPEDTLLGLEPSEAEEALQLTKELSGMLRHAYDLD
jgi:hypothetical protein